MGPDLPFHRCGTHKSTRKGFVFFLYLPGLDFLRTFEGELEDDIVYTDDDDDEDDDHYCPQHASHRSLEPHPRIKQLTDEVLHFGFTSFRVLYQTV